VLWLPRVRIGELARCPRCRATVLRDREPRRLSRAAALALAALILYPVAMALPIMEIERLGHSRSATILSGVVDLAAEGDWLVSAVVLVCSVVAPLGKLGAILVLCLGGAALGREHRAMTYRAVEWLGRWGMLDVLLVAVLVAAVKLGSWVEIRPGPGAAAFALVVIFSLLSSAAFDPEAIWTARKRSGR
jgi:paraquat-inducible protein A